MKTINPNIPPPNGYKFRNQDGTIIVGNSWEGLTRNVLAYRQRAGHSTDNIWEMILNQVCETTPGFCRDPANREGLRGVKESLKAKAMAWLGAKANESRGSKLSQVDRNTAIIRARTCVGCPKRDPANMGCSACERNLTQLRDLAMDGQKCEGEKLGACAVTGEFLPLAIHLFLPPTEGDMPDFCWRRKP